MIKKIVIGIVVIIVILLVILSFSIDGIVKGAIEKTGTKVLGTKVTVQSVELSLFSGSGTIKGLVVANPTGFKEPYLFKLGEVNVAVSIPSLLTDTIVVKNVSITQPNIMFETNANSSNIQAILQNVEKTTGGKATHQAATKVHKKQASSEATGPTKNIMIQHFALTKPVVKGNLGGLATVDMQIPDVVLKAVGGEQGVSIQAATKQIINALTNALSHAKTQVKATKKGKELQQFMQGIGDLLHHKSH